MKKLLLTIKSLIAMLIIITTASISGCNQNFESNSAGNIKIDSLRNQIKELTAGNEMIAKNFATFDALDYNVFSNQEWTRLHESHSKDIKVIWPDGHFTIGIAQYIKDLNAVFVYAPNTIIKQHPIRFGSGNMTCATGIITTTFSKPIQSEDGKLVAPASKSISLPMCAVGIWNGGVMIEEYLFWDNNVYKNQIVLNK